MYIRWLGSFRTNGSLSESIDFEMSRQTNVACEKFNRLSQVRAKVGLLVDPSAVYKKFPSDVWSEYTPDGNLYHTSVWYDGKTKHKECFAKPIYTGLVIKGGFDLLKNAARKQILVAIKEGFSLPIYNLVDGKLTEIRL